MFILVVYRRRESENRQDSSREKEVHKKEEAGSDPASFHTLVN